MFERELVSEFVGRAAEDRRVAEGVQRRAAPQQFGIRGPGGVRAPNGGSPVAYSSLRAAIRTKDRSTGYVIGRFKRRMICCAEFGGSSSARCSGRPLARAALAPKLFQRIVGKQDALRVSLTV